MTRHFRSKSCGIVRFPEFHPDPFPRRNCGGLEAEEDEFSGPLRNPVSTPCIAPVSGFSGDGGGDERGRDGGGGNQSAILDVLVAALRKSVVTCGVEAEDVASMEIGWPSEVRHVSHVTFDRFNGFLGLPSEFEPEIPRKVPSASAKVFGVCANSMQCTYDDKGNSVPTILLMMQKRLYVEGGLKAEGIFRINAENSQEEYVRDQLNNGIVPRGIDVHCLAGLIKAWFRELPSGVLDSLTPEQVMLCNTEDDCSQLVKLLPPTEAALLDWAINLMADVVEHEQYNKMNARNIAMVFAPNMTQMADPLTALIHAVQVMNFLKTLIVKKLNEREQSVAQKTLLSPDQGDQRENSIDIRVTDDVAPSSGEFLRSATMSGLEFGADEKYSSVKRKNNGEDEPEIGDGNGDWLSLRRGVRRLCRHPVFQLGKSGKKGQDIEIVNNRGADNWGYI